MVGDFTDSHQKVIETGNLDVITLVPGEIATLSVTMLSQCLCIIQIKTPRALNKDLEKCIYQNRLQLLSLSTGDAPSCHLDC